MFTEKEKAYLETIDPWRPQGIRIYGSADIIDRGGGFLADEDAESLGQELKLPPWLERHRAEIEQELTPITAPEWPPEGVLA